MSFLLLRFYTGSICTKPNSIHSYILSQFQDLGHIRGSILGQGHIDHVLRALLGEPCLPPYGVFHGSLQSHSPHRAGPPLSRYTRTPLTAAALLPRTGPSFMFLSALVLTLLERSSAVSALLVKYLIMSFLVMIPMKLFSDHPVPAQSSGSMPSSGSGSSISAVCLNRTVVTPAAYGCNRYPLSPFQIQIKLGS